MKRSFRIWLFFTSLLLNQSSLGAVSLDLGPFSVRFDGGFEKQTPAFHFYNDPICRAIQQLKLIEIYVQKGDFIDKLVVEPYALGYAKNGELILQGVQVAQQNLTKEDGLSRINSWRGKGTLGGEFSTFKEGDWLNIRLDKILEIRVLEDTGFMIRRGIIKKDLIQERNRIVQPLCMID